MTSSIRARPYGLTLAPRIGFKLCENANMSTKHLTGSVLVSMGCSEAINSDVAVAGIVPFAAVSLTERRVMPWAGSGHH